MATKNKKKSKKNNTSLFVIALIVLAFIIVLVTILVKKDQILTNYKETQFFDRVFGSTPEFVEKHEVPPKKDVAENETVTLNVLSEKNKSAVETKNTKTPETDNKIEKETSKPSSTNTTEIVKEVKKQEEPAKTQEDKKTEPIVSTTDLQVCFVYIDPDGSIVRKMVKKTVPKSDSPLTASINLLLKGPDISKSEEKNYMSLIPSGTKLISAKVQGGVAYLNFNENFEMNSFGIDGFQSQLMQVVYTATAFSTVNSVQFLIEGEKREYLSEGIWIGTPLSRGSF